MNKILKFIPNILTLLRFFLTPIILYYLNNNKVEISIIIFLVAAITDFFDGYIARKLKIKTYFGQLIDPLADKIFIISILYFFYMKNNINKYFFYFILFKELFLILISSILLILKIKKHKIISKKSGKIAMFFSSIYVLLLIINLQYKIYYLNFFLVIVFILSIITMVDYLFTINSNKT